MTIIPLENIKNFNILVNEVNDIIKKVQIEHNQIICQTIDPDSDDWQTGIGRIAELDYEEENLYTHINRELNGTVLADLIKKYNGFRTRIMIMPSRHCYSIHADPTPRIHIPIVTSDQAWMIWPYLSECKRMNPGVVYWVDTRKQHTFVNGGETARIHIVMGVEK
jgi:hypothetical protein